MALLFKMKYLPNATSPIGRCDANEKFMIILIAVTLLFKFASLHVCKLAKMQSFGLMDLIVCLANRIYAIVKVQRKLTFAGMPVIDSSGRLTGNSQPYEARIKFKRLYPT